MKKIILVLLAVLIVACGRNENSTDNTQGRVSPSFPDKCSVYTTFDQECIRLFDSAYGVGAGNSEKTRLGIEHSYSGRHRNSTAKPAPRIGEQ